MEVDCTLINTPEAESLCFFRHIERKCHLSSVMTHRLWMHSYFFFLKGARKETAATAKMAETSERGPREETCVGQTRRVWPHLTLSFFPIPEDRSPHGDVRILPDIPGWPLFPILPRVYFRLS